MNVQRSTSRTDRDLAEAVRGLGDEEAFRELYRRHTPRLLGFVSRLIAGGNPEDEDIVQETWIRACRRFDQFQWKSTFSTWLLGIGLNVVRDSTWTTRYGSTSNARSACCQTKIGWYWYSTTSKG